MKLVCLPIFCQVLSCHQTINTFDDASILLNHGPYHLHRFPRSNYLNSLPDHGLYHIIILPLNIFFIVMHSTIPYH
jgi:hypothetical protein